MLTGVRSALAGRYAVERELGRGATAIVYAARDLKHGRRVALKVVEPHVATTLGTDRFLQEIRTTAGLNHPHILPLFDSGEAGGFMYYTMPLVEGESLRDRLDRSGRIQLEVVLPLGAQIADALSYAHSAGIVHRDIKPENIMVGAHEHVWVADFGLARALTSAADHRLTGTGLAVGSPQYMSPEQAAGETDIDGRSDIYSLACILFEALCGEPPFTAGSVSSLLARHLSEAAPSIRDRCPDIPAPVDAALRQAMAKDPSHRFRRADEFLAAMHGQASPSVDLSTATAPRKASRKRARYLAPAMLAVLVALLAVIAIYVLPSLRRPAGGGEVVAIFPFRTAGLEVSQWTEGVPDLLSSMLDGAAGLVLADPWSLWKDLRNNPTDIATSPDPERAAGLARRSRANRFVLGAIVATGDSIHVSARIYDTRSVRPLHTLTAAGVALNVPDIVRALAVQFIATTASERQDLTLGPIDAGLTRSPEALKAYMLARLAMRRGMLDSARIAIDESLTHDSLFTPAIVEAAVIGTWSQFARGEPYSGLRELIDRALARDSLLRGRERLRLTAMDASIRTDGAAAAAALHGIITQDSTDLHAWALLQYVSMAFGWQYGSTNETAVAISERALRLDSAYVPLITVRVWQAVALNEVTQYERLTRLLAADTTNELSRLTLSCLRSVTVADSAFSALVADAGMDRNEGLAMLRCVRTYDVDRSVALALAWRASADPWLSSRGLGEEARLQIARGRSREIADRLREGGLQSDFAWQLRLMLAAASLAGAADPAAGAAAVAALELVVPVDSAAALFETRPVWWTGWMIAAHHAQFGDTLLSRRWQRAMERFPRGGSPAGYASALHADVEARLAVQRGDFEGGLEHARRAFALWEIHSENQFESAPEPHIRLHLGLLYRSAGRADSAHALLRSLVPPTAWMGFLTARAAFELGVLEEEEGDDTAAERYYTMAWELWSGGDAGIEQWRSQTAQALERVRNARMEPS
ncbi:MAG: serine/threonine-protein kinase [Gemmatimonadota bacterium]